MTQPKVRLHYVDIARALSIILLVLGHTLGYSENSVLIYKGIYTFVVPLFFLVSGFVMRRKGTFLEFAKTRFIRIMLPYFIWAFLYLVPYLLLSGDVAVSLDRPSRVVWTLIRNTLYGVGKDYGLQQNSSLWFLPALFTMELACYWIFLLVEKINKAWAEAAVFLALMAGGALFSKYITFVFPWGLNTVFMASIFYYTGYILREYDIIGKIMNHRFKMLWILLFAAAGFTAGWKNGILVNFMSYRIGNALLAYASGICLSVVVLCFSYWIKKSQILEYIGRNTMSVMLFHKLLVVIFQTKLGPLTKILRNSSMPAEVGLGLGITALAVAFSLAAAHIIRKVFPPAIGEKRKI